MQDNNIEETWYREEIKCRKEKRNCSIKKGFK